MAAVPPSAPSRCCRSALAAAVLAAGLCMAMPVRAVSLADGRTADAAAAPAAPDGDDLRQLDKQVQLMLAEARRQQALLEMQRRRLAEAEATGAWVPWLLAGVVALLVAVGLLGWRLWRTRQDLARTLAALHAGLEAARPAVALNLQDLPDAVPATADASAAPWGDPALLAGAEPTGARPPARLSPTAVRPVSAEQLGEDLGLNTRDFTFGTGVPPRPVSVEELLDLDQQVDFFLALGQAQSAIDLLLGHVRSTGGTNAQPYFKLLEIYREQGDEEAYERTRERFNQRFNAHAPDWTGDLDGGRFLEDYPDLVQRLQRAWAQPMRAVAELEGLLLRRADLEPLDLPAYRDLLMLHAMVRDMPASPVAAPEDSARPAPAASLTPSLAAAAPSTTPSVLSRAEDLSPDIDFAPVQAVRSDTVDLLLPLGEEPLEITLPRPHMADRPQAQAMLADWVFSRVATRRAGADPDGLAPPGRSGERPSQPMRLDLDLSEYAPAPREFTRPAAFTDIDMRRDKRLSDLGGLDEAGGADPLPSRR